MPSRLVLPIYTPLINLVLNPISPWAPALSSGSSLAIGMAYFLADFF
jgi:hypothetical protein